MLTTIGGAIGGLSWGNWFALAIILLSGLAFSLDWFDSGSNDDQDSL
jgi:hypothetical protein